MDKYAIIVAGGMGTRMGTNLPKQFVPIRDKPVIWYTVNAFMDAFEDITIILVLPLQHIETGRDIVASMSAADRIWITTGGATRFHSVLNGLKLLPPSSVVFIHDGVRCLITPELIHRCYHAAVAHGNAIPAIPVTDTMRIETGTGTEMIDRSKVKIIQTPQTFLSDIIKTAFVQDYQESFTDEASVAERSGVKIHLVEGEATNIKITRQIDLLIAERVLEEREREA